MTVNKRQFSVKLHDEKKQIKVVMDNVQKEHGAGAIMRHGYFPAPDGKLLSGF